MHKFVIHPCSDWIKTRSLECFQTIWFDSMCCGTIFQVFHSWTVIHRLTIDRFVQKMIFKQEFFNLFTLSFQQIYQLPTTIDVNNMVIYTHTHILNVKCEHSNCVSMFSILKIFRRRASFCIAVRIENGIEHFAASMRDVIKSTIWSWWFCELRWEHEIHCMDEKNEIDEEKLNAI